MNSELPQRPALNPMLEIKPAESGAILEDIETGRSHYVNASSAYILSLCDGATTVGEIVALVQETFALSDPPNELVTDAIRQFIDLHVVLDAK